VVWQAIEGIYFSPKIPDTGKAVNSIPSGRATFPNHSLDIMTSGRDKKRPIVALMIKPLPRRPIVLPTRLQTRLVELLDLFTT
jgi:hypothetical protein